MALPESQHPYLQWSIDEDQWDSVPGAARIALTFDLQTEVYQDTHYITILRGDGSVVARYTGTDLAGQTIVIPGPDYGVRLNSQQTVTSYYGYKITSAVSTESELTSPFQFRLLDYTLETQPPAPSNQHVGPWFVGNRMWTIGWGICDQFYFGSMLFKRDVSGSGTGDTASMPYMEWYGTWEDLGVPAGSTVTSIRTAFRTKCAVYWDGVTSYVGPVELRDGAGGYRATFARTSGEHIEYTTQTEWEQYLTNTMAGLSEASSTQIGIRFYVEPNVQNVFNCKVFLLADYPIVIVGYSPLQSITKYFRLGLDEEGWTVSANGSVNVTTEWTDQWEYDSDAYGDGIGGSSLRFYYSDDSGAIWHESDTDHRPYDAGASGVWKGEGEDTVWVAYRENSANTLNMTTFDLGSGLWGSSVTGPVLDHDDANSFYVYLTKRDDGTFVVPYTDITGGLIRPYARIYDPGSGVFSARTSISPGTEIGTTRGVRGVWNNSAGHTNIFWMSKSPSTTPYRLYHRVLRSDDTLGDTQLVGIIGRTGNSESSGQDPSSPIEVGGKLYLWYARGLSTTETVPAVFIGSPSDSETPTWTTEDISDALCAYDIQEWGANGTLALDGGLLVAFWVTPTDPLTLTTLHLNDVYKSVMTDGNWSSSLFWDPVDFQSGMGVDAVYGPSVAKIGDQWAMIASHYGPRTQGPSISFKHPVQGFMYEIQSISYECLTIREKHPDDVIDLPITWTGFLNGDIISSFGCTATVASLTVGATSFTNTETTARLSGGLAGTDYYARYQIGTEQGMTEVRTIKIKVKECS